MAEGAEGTYERNDFLVTLQSLKLSADENSKLELTELKAIHKAVKENTEFVSKLTSVGSADAEVNNEVAATSVTDSSSADWFKPMTTLQQP